MVAVLHAVPGAGAPQAVAEWLDGLRPVYGDDAVARIAAAWQRVCAATGETRGADGERLIDRALGTATILAGLKLDPASICAALLAPLPALGAFDAEDVAVAQGADVAALVAGVARMNDIRALPAGVDTAERAAQAENLRKMLLAMVEDIRVVLIKLAERTQALRHLMSGDESLRRLAAREVTDLFAPLANRLGVWQLKWELEDLALRALEPDGVQGDRALARRAAARPPALHRGRDRDAVARASRRRHRRRRHRSAEAHHQHLEQDASQGRRHRRALRHPRGARPGRRRQGVLHGARHRPPPVDAACRRVRRLHREAQGQRLPVAAHRGDRARGQAARGADPHARHAPPLRVRRRRALALQGERRRASRGATPASTRRSAGCGRC